MKTTLRDIAKLANVSAATVSRAFNSPEKVRPLTLKRITDAAREAGYEFDIPSSVRSLPMGRTIACLTKDVRTPFIASAITALSKIASLNGYFLSTHITCTEKFEKQLFDIYSHSECAGIILTGDSYISQIDSRIPVCVLDETDRISGSFFNVSSDNHNAILLLLEHLLRLGHTKIGFISGDPNTSSGNVRRQIITELMSEHLLDMPEEYIFEGNFALPSGVAAFDYFYSLSDMPTAVIASNDEMAKGFIVRANSLGVRIPEDISVCGIDTIADDLFIPKITSVIQDTQAIAKTAFDSLVNPNSGDYTKKIIPVVFSPGDTTYKLT